MVSVDLKGGQCVATGSALRSGIWHGHSKVKVTCKIMEGLSGRLILKFREQAHQLTPI